MKVTFTLHNLTASYLASLESAAPKDAFDRLRKDKYDGLSHAIKMKVGNGEMRDAVELNSMHKNEKAAWAFKLEPRKGYKLATFNVNA